MAILAISFGDGSLAFRRAAKRVAEDLKDFRGVTLTVAISRSQLFKDLPTETKKIHWEQNRLGFYAWKPLSLLWALKFLPKNFDSIVYADGGCWINRTTESESRFLNYCETSKNYGGLTFSSGYLEKVFSKFELINAMHVPSSHLDSNQRAGGAWFISTDLAFDFATEWWKFGSQNELINDRFKQDLQFQEFVAHRHDQSIFSLLAKQFKIPESSDEIHIHPFKKEIGSYENSVPIWAARHRSGFRSLSMNPIHRAVRAIEQNLP